MRKRCESCAKLREQNEKLKKQNELFNKERMKAYADRDYYAEQVADALNEASFHATKYYNLLEKVYGERVQ